MKKLNYNQYFEDEFEDAETFERIKKKNNITNNNTKDRKKKDIFLTQRRKNCTESF